MQQISQYAKALPAILAEMEKGREKDEKTGQNAETGEPEVIHVYPLEGGGLVFTKTPIEEDVPGTIIVDSQEPDTEIPPTPKREPPYFLYFFLILLLFLLLDSGDTTLLALLTPTATITIIPKAEAITTTATVPIASLHGRVLPALTLTQSDKVSATGRGHQDARSATGILTFYNGLSTAQSIASGMVFTGADGIKVATDQPVYIPAANPPQFGEATVSASALNAGNRGNINALAINLTVSTGLFVKNLSAFTGGQDARDYTYVKSSDIQHAITVLTPQLTQSMQAALTAQLIEGEGLVSPSCTTTESADHQPEDQATEVKVTVSKTCSAVVYNKMALHTQATGLLVSFAGKRLGAGYKLLGSVQVTLTQADHTPPNLVLSIQGTWVYQINEESTKNLVAGKHRLEAIHLLSHTPGIERVFIAGIADNGLLPIDVSHIHLLILVGVSSPG